MEVTFRPAIAAPVLVADQRPTADATALARDPTPETPLPLPASTSQGAATISARLGLSPDAVGSLAPVERTLKPWGIRMLPDDAARQAARDRARAAAARADAAAALKADADAKAEVAARDAAEADRTPPPAPQDTAQNATPPEDPPV
ncbi:hypothetical protein [Pelagovum pacificum]|uniref:Uncharacterized protein n=1 Tax=Pelagovum pacificum TaxID=2588711 RepID=A0A5C5GFS0_9RHOB|nr:hypothetical protein [Pelagovum pacificum]TNY32819.1 hypothetical protein FHY64_05955 [Pelagovum pacificum]